MPFAVETFVGAILNHKARVQLFLRAQKLFHFREEPRARGVVVAAAFFLEFAQQFFLLLQIGRAHV